MPEEILKFGELTLVVRDEPARVVVTWLGRSTARSPAMFVLPVLLNALERAAEKDLVLVIEFQRLDYMNSSTLTPLIRLIELVNRRGRPLEVNYAKDLKWQSISFTALEIFHGRGSHVRIVGV